MVEKLNKDMIEAMKAGDKNRLTVIRMVKAALKQEEIDHKKEVNDDLLIDVVNKQIKMRKDSITEFEKGNRQDLIDATQKEMAEICGMSTAMLSKLERGLAPQRLRAIVLYRASRHFRISVETLLTSLSD